MWQGAPGGDLEVIAGENAQTADALVARSHLNGIPVLMGISGRLSGIDGWALYESNDFGNVIRDPQTRDILIENIVSYVSEKKMDGVDIMMTDLNSGLASSNAAAVGPFITALKALCPKGPWSLLPWLQTGCTANTPIFRMQTGSMSELLKTVLTSARAHLRTIVTP